MKIITTLVLALTLASPTAFAAAPPADAPAQQPESDLSVKLAMTPVEPAVDPLSLSLVLALCSQCAPCTTSLQCGGTSVGFCVDAVSAGCYWQTGTVCYCR